MSEIDLVIKILTDANTQGIKQASTSVEELTTAVKHNSAATNASSQALNGLRGNMGDVKDASQAAAALMRGDLAGAMRELQGLSGSSSAALMKIGGAAGAAFMGWQIGSLIREFKGLGAVLDRLAISLVTDIPHAARTSTAELNRLNEVRLDGLMKQLDNIDSRLESTLRRFSEASRNQDQIDSSRAELEMALLERQLANDPDRDRKLSAAKADATDRQLAQQSGTLTDMLSTAEGSKSDLASRRSELESELSQAKERMNKVSAAITNSQKLGGIPDEELIEEARQARFAWEGAKTRLDAFMEEYGSMMEKIDSDMRKFRAELIAIGNRRRANQLRAQGEQDTLEAEIVTTELNGFFGEIDSSSARATGGSSHSSGVAGTTGDSAPSLAKSDSSAGASSDDSFAGDRDDPETVLRGPSGGLTGMTLTGWTQKPLGPIPSGGPSRSSGPRKAGGPLPGRGPTNGAGRLLSFNLNDDISGLTREELQQRLRLINDVALDATQGSQDLLSAKRTSASHKQIMDLRARLLQQEQDADMSANMMTASIEGLEHKIRGYHNESKRLLEMIQNLP